MPNQMIALQSRGAKMPDPTAQTAKFVNMMNMAKQQEAAQRQASLAQQSMDINQAQEARAVELHGPALKKAQLEYVGLVADQFSRDVAKLKDGDIAGAEALRANIVNEIPAWGSYIRPASEWTTEYRTQLMLKGKEIADKTIPDVVASKEYAAPGAKDAQGNPIPENTVIDTRIGGFSYATGSTPLRAGGAATPTTPVPQAMGTGADMRATQGSNTTPQDLFSQGMNPNNIPSGMPTSPASFTGGMGGAGAVQMTPEVMSRIADSAFQTGVMAQVDFDQLLATQPPENRQAFTDAFRRANVTIQADAPSLADSGMGQQQMAANPVQRPQAGFADFRGPTPQSRTANLGGDMSMMRNTEAQYIPVQRRDVNVAPIPSPVPAAVLGAQEGAKTTATKNVELGMNPKIAAATKKAENAIALKSEAPAALSGVKGVISDLDIYIETIDKLLRSPDRHRIVGRIEGNLGRLGSLGQDERQADLQAMFDRIKNADTLASLISMKQATPTGGSPVGPASNLDVQLIAKGANALIQTGSVASFDEELKTIRRKAYRARANAIEAYNSKFGELSASDPRFKLNPRPIADRYISTKDLPQNRTPVIPTLTPEQVRAAPSGTVYRTTDGRRGTKP